MTVQEILSRIWEGRRWMRELHIDPELKNVEIIMSVDAHMRVMTCRDEFSAQVQYDPKLPAGLRIFGLVVQRDPMFRDDEIRLRSEVAL